MTDRTDQELAEDIAAEAYQVIGALAHATGTFDDPEVIRALDYFSGSAFDGSILPWIAPEIPNASEKA